MKGTPGQAILIASAFLGCCLGTQAADRPPLPPLTTEPSAPRLTGKFVWADLVTYDTAAAAKFYGGLFGWTFRDYGGYLIGANDERPLCGLVQRPRPEETAAQPRWIGYISVDNVQRAQRWAAQNGGRVLAPPQKFPERGEQAVLSDPEGARFGVVRSSRGDPSDFLASPGDWIWIQLLCRHPQATAEFYRELAGYEVLENTDSPRPDDFVLSSDGYARAVVNAIPEGYEDLKPTWLLFVRVASTSEALANAKRLGGRVLINPKPGLFGGRLAVVADPTGGAIGLLEWNQEDPGDLP